MRISTLWLCAVLALMWGVLPAQEAPAKKKLKLAVLRIAYESFSEQERQLVNQRFYSNLKKDQRVQVMTEAEVRERLVPLGIDPGEITNEQGYTMVGRLLEVNYVLVGTMDKIGDFVEVTFRTFKMPSGTHKR